MYTDKKMTSLLAAKKRKMHKDKGFPLRFLRIFAAKRSLKRILLLHYPWPSVSIRG
jgi:hypothetical protein